MKDKDLCKWLRDNSSGTYSPSAEAANRIEQLIDYIERSSIATNTCTENILGEVCCGCECGKADV